MRYILILALFLSRSAFGFSLLGPFDTWQTADLDYGRNPFLYYGDNGGPQNLGEEYRWNTPVLTYGFDSSFLDYFGQRGVQEVDKAINIINSLPPFSQLSANLTEFPLNTQRSNFRAEALGLYDLKSATLAILLEELGLAHPERFVWTLRARQLPQGAQSPNYNFLVIKRNFDPITFEPSSYVNGTLYTYSIIALANPDTSDAFEAPVDPTEPTHTSVATVGYGLFTGGYYTGLTKDDVGGLRYLYRPSNLNVEPPPLNSTLETTLPPFFPISFLTNGLQTNTVTVPPTGLRGGIDKLTFRKVDFENLLSPNVFLPITNRFVSTIFSNSIPISQVLERVTTTPDFVFSADDLVVVGNTITVNVFSRYTPVFNTTTRLPSLNGPGTITGPVNITFSKLGPYLINASGTFDEIEGSPGIRWGSFDGTPKEPVVYPSGTSIAELENIILGF